MDFTSMFEDPQGQGIDLSESEFSDYIIEYYADANNIAFEDVEIVKGIVRPKRRRNVISPSRITRQIGRMTISPQRRGAITSEGSRRPGRPVAVTSGERRGPGRPRKGTTSEETDKKIKTNRRNFANKVVKRREDNEDVTLPTRVVNVSNLTSDGTGSQTIQLARAGEDLVEITRDLPLVSNNRTGYLKALEILFDHNKITEKQYDSYSKRAIQQLP